MSRSRNEEDGRPSRCRKTGGRIPPDAGAGGHSRSVRRRVDSGLGQVEYVYPLTEEPADRRKQYDPSVAQVNVTCFHVTAPDEWEPKLDWEHDDHRWCEPGEAFTNLRWPATAEALRKLLILKAN
jgi:hypothetical protein